MKYHSLSGLNDRICFDSSGDCKVKVKVLVGLVSPAASIIDWQMVVFVFVLFCVKMLPFLKGHQSDWILAYSNGPILI